MLSVLIPVYNYDVRELVEAIQKQVLQENIPFEIVVDDDASKESFKKTNREIAAFQGVRYLEEPVNLGRSKIRNKLAEVANYKYLLFMDCDSGIVKDSFIKDYISNIKKSPIIYGGTEYPKNLKIRPTLKLHWLYGAKREQQQAKQRNQYPNRGFHTNNFLIEKDLLLSIRFNENINGYGHEDTLFGYELLKKGVSIFHIDNPVAHLGLEPNEEFLRKTRESIKNLKKIMRINGNENRLVRDITILAYYKKIEKVGLNKAVEFFYKRYEHILRKNLLGERPRLLLFDLYKLGYLCSINGEKHN